MDKLILLLLCTVLSVHSLSGQIKVPTASEKVRFEIKPLLLTHKSQKIVEIEEQPRFAFVKKDHQYENFAIFCKLEHKLQLKARIPIKFRLGTLDYVNKLEGKY